MTVVSEVPQVWASSVMVELATPSGSSMTRCATRRSAGGREGSRERTLTTVLSGVASLVVLVGAAGEPSPPASPVLPGSEPVGFLMEESFLLTGCHVNGRKGYG